ncbi:MAG: hypothetical protein AAFY88_14870, partial [Acidobacteriota bacterium]
MPRRRDRWGARAKSIGAWRCLVGAAALSVTLSVAADEIELDPPSSSGDQQNPAVALDSSGGAMVVWQDFRNSGRSVWARRFDSAGQALGSSFSVVDGNGQLKGYPGVAATDTDGFVVVWERLGGGASPGGIAGRVYDAAGQAVGAQFDIQEDTSEVERRPEISKAPDGSFVVTWTARDDSLRARRLDAGGQPVGGELILDIDSGTALGSSLSHNDSGDFLVVWRRSMTSVGQLFDANGVPLASELDIPGEALGTSAPAVAFSGDRFLAVAITQTPIPFTLSGQFFSAAGLAIGDELIIDASVSQAITPAVAAAPGGEFEVLWNQADGNGSGVFRRRVSSTGELLGVEARVNREFLGDQLKQDVKVDAQELAVDPRLDAQELARARDPAPEDAGAVAV